MAYFRCLRLNWLGRSHPAARTGRFSRRTRCRRLHVYYVAPDGKAERQERPWAADHARSGHRAGRHRRRHHPARRRLPHRRTAAQPGHHDAALQRRAPDPQGHPGGDRVGNAARRHVAHAVENACSPRSRSTGGAATARACGRRCTDSTTTWCSSTASCCSRPVGRARSTRDHYYIDYEKGYVYIGVEPRRASSSRSPRIDSALVRTSRPVARQGVRPQGPAIRGITFTQYAYRALEIEGKKQFTSADETDRRTGGPRRTPPPSARRSSARCSRT